VEQVTLHESRLMGVHQPAPGDAKGIQNHSPGLKAENPWIPKCQELRKEVNELLKRTVTQTTALKKAREEHRELRSEKLTLEAKALELEKEIEALKDELGQPGLVAHLVKLFKDATMFTSQADVAEKIVKLGDKSAIRHLESYLKDEDRHVRCNAAFVLAGLGDRRGFDVIAEVTGDKSERPKAQGIPGGNWTVGRQIKADRYYAIHILGMLKSARTVPILVPLLKDPELGYKAAWALGEAGGPEAVEPLVNALGHESPNVRVGAIKSLEKLCARSALPRLRPLLDDKARSNLGRQPSVGDAARKAINKLETEPKQPAVP